jgi:hypothetical protein
MRIELAWGVVGGASATASRVRQPPGSAACERFIHGSDAKSALFCGAAPDVVLTSRLRRFVSARSQLQSLRLAPRAGKGVDHQRHFNRAVGRLKLVG